MTTTVRHTELTNITTAVVVAGGAAVVSGQDYALETINRTLAAIDVGATAGKTQDAAGMIFAEFTGSVIKRVISATVFRTTGGVDNVFLGGAGPILAKYGFTITTANNVSTLRLIDSAATTGLLAAADRVVVTVEVGNS